MYLLFITSIINYLSANQKVTDREMETIGYGVGYSTCDNIAPQIDFAKTFHITRIAWDEYISCSRVYICVYMVLISSVSKSLHLSISIIYFVLHEFCRSPLWMPISTFLSKQLSFLPWYIKHRIYDIVSVNDVFASLWYDMRNRCRDSTDVICFHIVSFVGYAGPLQGSHSSDQYQSDVSICLVY